MIQENAHNNAIHSDIFFAPCGRKKYAGDGVSFPVK